MRYAAVDIGDQLLPAAHSRERPAMANLVQRLGDYPYRRRSRFQGEISPAAVERTIKGLKELQELITRFQVENARSRYQCP